MSDWSELEEKDFASLMATGLERLPAIRLYRRCKSDITKAFKIATAAAASSDRGRALAAIRGNQAKVEASQ